MRVQLERTDIFQSLYVAEENRVDIHPNEMTDELRVAIERTYVNSRERSLTLTKLDELEMWMQRSLEVEA